MSAFTGKPRYPPFEKTSKPLKLTYLRNKSAEQSDNERVLSKRHNISLCEYLVNLKKKQREDILHLVKMREKYKVQ